MTSSDRDEIREVLARYNLSGDRGRLDELARCFAEAGVLEFEGEILKGREAIRERLGRVAADFGARSETRLLRHHLTTQQIEFTGPDSAQVTSYFLVVTDIGLDHWGRYRDDLLRTPEGWLLGRRRVVVEGRAAGSHFPEERG